MTRIVTISLLKGGVAKTTTAIALAEAAAEAMTTVVVDTDPQGSAGRWAALAEAEGTPLRSRVVALPHADLGRRLAGVTRGADMVVIDGPPPGALAIARAGIAVADLVLMPVPARLADLDRCPATVQTAQAAGKDIAAVLVMVRAGTSAPGAARAALWDMKVPVLATEMPLRESIAAAYGQPVSGLLAWCGRQLLTDLQELP